MARLALVIAKFNQEITGKMEESALRQAQRLHAEVVHTAQVPGSYDIPVVAKRLLDKEDVDAVVALGAIIKGGTMHDQLIATALADALARLSLESGKPVTLGVMGPGITWKQAVERKETYAERAVQAAVELVG